MEVKFTVFFEDPFWVGVFECWENGFYQTARVVFGSEPKDYEVYELILKNYYDLELSKPIKVEQSKELRINPKRLQRKVKKEVSNSGIGTKAQQAIKKAQEDKKLEKRKHVKELRAEQSQLKFVMRQEKKKQKKKGH